MRLVRNCPKSLKHILHIHNTKATKIQMQTHAHRYDHTHPHPPPPTHPSTHIHITPSPSHPTKRGKNKTKQKQNKTKQNKTKRASVSGHRNCRKCFQKERDYQGGFDRTDGGSMRDRNRELKVPGTRS